MNQEYGAMVRCDLHRCTGCRACELACVQSHGVAGATVGTLAGPVKPRLFVPGAGEKPILCRHCEDAPCLNACPRGAGQARLDEEKCGDCGEVPCVSACPFGAIRPAAGPVKCDLCGGDPACVRACPNGALTLVHPEKAREEKNARALEWLRRMV